MTPGVSIDCALNSFMMSRNCARRGEVSRIGAVSDETRWYGPLGRFWAGIGRGERGRAAGRGRSCGRRVRHRAWVCGFAGCSRVCVACLVVDVWLLLELHFHLIQVGECIFDLQLTIGLRLAGGGGARTHWQRAAQLSLLRRQQRLLRRIVAGWKGDTRRHDGLWWCAGRGRESRRLLHGRHAWGWCDLPHGHLGWRRARSRPRRHRHCGWWGLTRRRGCSGDLFWRIGCFNGCRYVFWFRGRVFLLCGGRHRHSQPRPNQICAALSRGPPSLSLRWRRVLDPTWWCHVTGGAAVTRSLLSDTGGYTPTRGPVAWEPFPRQLRRGCRPGALRTYIVGRPRRHAHAGGRSRS